MHTPPSRPRDEERVGVALSPPQAREVARALRVKLACEFDRPFDEPLPSREDAARLRTLLDLCVDQLESLAWGEPLGDVRMIAPRLLLDAIARDLIDGGEEILADPVGWNPAESHRVRRQGRRMIRAAAAINGALASEPQYELALQAGYAGSRRVRAVWRRLARGAIIST